jgi:hypothetical protein
VDTEKELTGFQDSGMVEGYFRIFWRERRSNSARVSATQLYHRSRDNVGQLTQDGAEQGPDGELDADVSYL